MALSDSDYRLIVETTSTLIWRADLTGTRDYFNSAWLAFTGLSLSQALNDGWRDSLYPEDRSNYAACSYNQVIAQEPYSLIFRLRRYDGAWRWIRESGCPLGRGSAVTGFIGSGHDVTDLIEDLTEARLFQQLGERDVLTGLLSRAYTTHLLGEQYGSGALPVASLGIVLMDLDGFKAINDTCGHLVGDRALQAASQHLTGLLRSGDWLCRWGGDEFLLVVHRPSGDLEAIAQRISQSFSTFRFTDDSFDFPLGCSVGSALANGQATLDELLAEADRALYAVKQQRRRTRER